MYIHVVHCAVHSECWFDSVIFDICIMNAIGIEIGLLFLKYVLKRYPLFPDWKLPFKALCGEKRECGTLFWWFIIWTLIELPLATQIFTFALYDHTLELLDRDHMFSTGSQIVGYRYSVVIWSTVPAFNQLYEWMHCKENIQTVSWTFIRKSYWIIVIKAIFVIELMLTLIYYPK